MKYKILIVEDDVVISEHLKTIVSHLNYQVTEICTDLSEAMDSIQLNKPDLALLDIRMDGEDQGIEIARQIKKLDIPFVFITSFTDKNTIQSAIKEQPLGYILKPFSAVEIKDVIEGAFKVSQSQIIQFKHSSSQININYNSIKWIKSDNVYIEVYTENKKFVIREKLNDFVKKLPENTFYKVHRSYVINKNHVHGVQGNIIIIDNNQIPVSRQYKDILSELVVN